MLDNETWAQQKFLNLKASAAEGKITSLTDPVMYRVSKFPEIYQDDSMFEELFKD